MIIWLLLAQLGFAGTPQPGLYVLEPKVVTEWQMPVFGRNRVNTKTRSLARLMRVEGVPTPGRDLRVSDAGGDRRPGATVHLDLPFLGTVEVHPARRTRTSLRGEMTVGGSRGIVDVQSNEQGTLGSMDPLVRTSPGISAIPRESSFSLVPLADGIGWSQIGDRA